VNNNASSYLTIFTSRGGARHFRLGRPLEGPVLQQGELSMVCIGLAERDLKNFGGAVDTPSSAPVHKTMLGLIGYIIAT